MSREQLIARLEAIADDFHPDRDQDAPLALQEMRTALGGLVAEAKASRVAQSALAA